MHTSAVRKAKCMNISEHYRMDGPAVSRPNGGAFSMVLNICKNLPIFFSASKSTITLLSLLSPAPDTDPTGGEEQRCSARHDSLHRTAHLSLTDAQSDVESQFILIIPKAPRRFPKSVSPLAVVASCYGKATWCSFLNW